MRVFLSFQMYLLRAYFLSVVQKLVFTFLPKNPVVLPLFGILLWFSAFPVKAFVVFCILKNKTGGCILQMHTLVEKAPRDFKFRLNL